MAAAPPILLMTRPQMASEQFVAKLMARQAVFAPVISPLMDIVWTDNPVSVDGAAGLIFTSANGVAAWKARARPEVLPTYVVGPATAQAAQLCGLPPRIIQPNAAALVAAMLQAGVKGPLLHLTGTHRRGDIAGQLTAGGIPTRAEVLYDQPQMPLNAQAKTALAGENPVVVPIFSPRTAQLLANAPIKAPLLVAAMSEAVVNNLTSLHIVSVKVAARPDSGAMLDAVLTLFDAARAGMIGSGGGPLASKVERVTGRGRHD